MMILNLKIKLKLETINILRLFNSDIIYFNLIRLEFLN